MIGWNRVTTKGASEIVRARLEAISAVDLDSEVCEGDVQLEIKPFESFRQINKYTKYLSTIENLKILSESWSEDEGFNIIISMQVPLALGRLLQDMPEVARVHINGKKTGYSGYKKECKKMVVEMKTTDAVPEPVLV
jgi:hypothetical protein